MTPKHIEQFQKRLIEWYRRHHRRLPWRETDDPYRIWISEVMLQQTQVQTVLPYYQKFLLLFPHVKQLADADLQKVLKAWEGLGYYARARNMHRAAKILVEQTAGKLPENWASVRALPGVGDYIAAAILSLAFNQPYAVVDGNVKRVLARLYEIGDPINKSSSYKIFKETAGRLLDHRHPGIFNQAMMELGATICKPGKPECNGCPVCSLCHANQAGNVDKFPKRIKIPKTPLHHIAVGVVYKNNHMLITRRKFEGLLGGLWEFPGGKVRKHETPESACVREIKEEVNLGVAVAGHIAQVKHAYTHFKILMDVFSCRYVAGDVKLNGPIDFRWIVRREIELYPFPKANHKFIHLLD